MKDKVLYITSNHPWGIGGGSMASYAYLSAFTEVFTEYDIDLCICEEFIRDIPAHWLNTHSNITLHGVKRRCMVHRLLSILNGQIHRFHCDVIKLVKSKDYKLCVFDRSDTAGTIIRHLPLYTKKIVIHHNYEPDYYKGNASALFNLLFYRHIVTGEKNAYRNSDLNIFLTKEDECQLHDAYGVRNGKNVVFGLFPSKVESLTPVESLKSRKTIVITGSLNNLQNTDGIEYFIKELYPHVPNDYQIIIAGQNPTETIQKLCKNNSRIKLIANPTDIIDVVKQGSIYVCPARLGSGIKVRVMDGLRNGLPILAHTVSARGYNAFEQDGVLYSFDTADTFATKLSNIIDSIDKERITPELIINSYMKNVSFVSVVKKLAKEIESL